MEQAIRNRLRNVATQCRKLLEESVAQATPGAIRPLCPAAGETKVHIEDEARMAHLC